MTRTVDCTNIALTVPCGLTLSRLKQTAMCPNSNTTNDGERDATRNAPFLFHLSNPRNMDVEHGILRAVLHYLNTVRRRPSLSTSAQRRTVGSM